MIFIILIAVFFLWKKTSIRRVPDNKVGIGIALCIEKDEISEKLLADFNYTLRNLLQGSKFKHEFEFVEIPQSIAKTIKDEDSARTLAKRSNLSLLLFGRVFTRGTSESPSHFIDFCGLIRHIPLDKNLTIKFGNEFHTALPRRYKFSSDKSLPECEFADQHVDAAAKYMIGITASFSGDFTYAEGLFLNSEALLKRYIQQSQASQLLALLEKVQAQIKELYKQWTGFEMQHYLMHRDNDHLKKCEIIQDKLHQRGGAGYVSHHISAICAVVLHDDISKAEEEVNACRGNKDAVYWYNKAFIDGYKGNLDECYKAYSKAFNEPLLDPTIPNQCEEFIQIVLEKKPDKSWLYFCLGLINLRAK